MDLIIILVSVQIYFKIQVSTLMAMKLFNMSDNKINVIPGELSIPTKLRELKFGNNKIKVIFHLLYIILHELNAKFI